MPSNKPDTGAIAPQVLLAFSRHIPYLRGHSIFTKRVLSGKANGVSFPKVVGLGDENVWKWEGNAICLVKFQKDLVKTVKSMLVKYRIGGEESRVQADRSRFPALSFVL